jgi:succinate dehydrogenase / fumarate reductase, cytochrome b subunit
MEQAALAAPEVDRSFWLRRLQSLTGLLPSGVFLLFHILENTKALGGEGQFNEAVATINSLAPRPYFYGLELFGLLLPLSFHALYGMYVVFQGQGNAGRYPYRSNRMYVLQRWTGIAAFFFLLFHVLALRVGISLFQHLITYDDLVAHFSAAPVVLVYLVGVLCAEFHLSNGLSGFAWSWGLAVSDRSRRVVERLGWVLFIALAIPSVHLILFLHH